MSELLVVKTRRKGKNLTQSVLIPTEKMVADELRAARPGHLSDLAELRRKLAAKNGADACCPVTAAALGAYQSRRQRALLARRKCRSAILPTYERWIGAHTRKIGG